MDDDRPLLVPIVWKTRAELAEMFPHQEVPMDEKRLKEIEEERVHSPSFTCEVTVPELLSEVRALTTLLEATYLPLSIRELRRTQGTAAAAKQWEEQSHAYLAGLQKQRDDALAEVQQLRLAVSVHETREAAQARVLVGAMHIRRAERERCAKVADAYAKRAWAAEHVSEPAAVAAEHVAGEIRALPDEG